MESYMKNRAEKWVEACSPSAFVAPQKRPAVDVDVTAGGRGRDTFRRLKTGLLRVMIYTKRF
jgi:hypothetical protein